MRVFSAKDDLSEAAIGDRIVFKPAYWFDNPALYSVQAASVPTVTGEVVYIHEAHRYLRCEYRTPAGCIGHECFKF